MSQPPLLTTPRSPARNTGLTCGTSLAFAFGLVGSASAVHAEVLWRGDFETGDLSQWSKVQSVADSRLQITDDPVRQGRYALRVEVRQGDDPINGSGNRTEIVRTVPDKEGDERWYSWHVLWPDDYPSSSAWQLFTQWHQSGNSGSPPLEFYVIGEELRLRINASEVVWTQPLERGVWHEFRFHVRWSSKPDVGFVELWFDDVHVLPLRHVPTMYAGMNNLLKQGLYRKDTVVPVGVVFHDGMTMATTLADLDPPPGTEPAPDPDTEPAPDSPAPDTSPAEQFDASPPPGEAPSDPDPVMRSSACEVSTSGRASDMGSLLLLGGLAWADRVRRARLASRVK